MSEATVTQPPTGYSVDLPDGWLLINVDPETSMRSMRRLLNEAAKHDDEIRAHRVELEQLLAQLLADASAAGVESFACTFSMINGILPLQASLTVAVHSLGGGDHDVGIIFRELADGETERSVDVVDLQGVGSVVRRSGRRQQSPPGSEQAIDYICRQFYVPVPRGADLILLTFASPTIDLTTEMNDLFDGIADTFTFTFDG